MRVLAALPPARSSPARNSECRRTPILARASEPPSSRSTTQTAWRTTSPASRRADTASASAPPDVTTSSTRHTSSPGLLALQPVRGAIFLRLTAHDDEGPSGRHGCRSSQRDRPEGRPGKPDGTRLHLLHGGRETLSELPEELRLRLEAVLVEVVGRALARAQDEVALEQGVLDEQLAERIDGRPGAHGASASSAADDERLVLERGRRRGLGRAVGEADYGAGRAS